MSTCALCNGKLIRQRHPAFPNVVLVGCMSDRCPYNIDYARLAVDVEGAVKEAKDAPDNHTNEG